MTVWFDFTTTVRNRGRSGIANAEWNIGQAVIAIAPETRCFELRGRRGLVELDPARRLEQMVYASPDAVAPTPMVVVPTWRDAVRGRLRRRLGRRADPLIRGLSTAYQLPAAVRRVRSEGWVRREPDAVGAPISDSVRAGDVVISMGADWDGELAARLTDLRRSTGCTVVTMVYDLIPLTHTHLAFHADRTLFTRYYRSLIGASDLITCISEQSRRHLVRFADDQGMALPRSAVLQLGEAEPIAPERTEGPRGEHFVCIGTVERRKNLELIYDALRILESEGHALPTVVVAGAPGWGTKDLLHELAQQSTAASRSIVLAGSVDDAGLDRLYRTTRALLFPSHFEGWGLPVREAAVRGCPVAAGDSPAIREAAAGYAGATFLPTDDPGPWADYLRMPPAAVDPMPVRPWTTVAGDLLALVPVDRPTRSDRPMVDAPSR